MTQAEEFAFSLAGVPLAGRRWRNGPRPVLALHGWLDNAASFDRLAPLLAGADVAAVDLAGHGLSYHRTPQARYDIWDDLTDLVRLADHLGWHSFHLVGHSRGAMIAALLTAALPERVLSVTLLDGFLPQAVPVQQTFSQLGRHLRQHLAPARTAVRYPDPERALDVRTRVAAMSVEAARPIVERGLQSVDGGWQWRADPRLQLASAVKLNHEQNRQLERELAAHSCLLLLAGSGLLADLRRRLDAGELQGIDHAVLPGSHHFHLESAAAQIAARIDRFWAGLPQRRARPDTDTPSH